MTSEEKPTIGFLSSFRIDHNMFQWFQFQVGTYPLWCPQGSILGPLFLIYITNLNCAIRYCSIHHLADDTNLLHCNNSVKRMNKQVNQDLKNLTN